MTEVDFFDEISKFIFTSKYAKYDEKLKRRETWDETVDRVQNMHLKKFRQLPKEDRDKIKWAFSLVKEKRIVPSMRSMQFGGAAVESHNPRVFNCAVRHVDSIRSFAEIFYLLLCGNGVGIGLSSHFLERFDDLVSPKDKAGTVITYVVQDTIEGWSDSLEALLNCYFKNTAYTGRKIVFDYSKIRAEGAPLKTGGGKAPGFKGLKNAHVKVKALLDYVIEHEHVTRMRAIHAYDILMHAADAVLSGGVRRSATCVIFDKTDKEMLEAKTNFPVDKKSRFSFDDDTKKYCGKVTVKNKITEVELDEFEYNQMLLKQGVIFWKHIEPQRARSNNSILLLRNQTSLAEFKEVIERSKQYGEPGFVFADHQHQLYNPCFEIGMIPVIDGICGVQFCNLTSINGARVNTDSDFFESIEAATIIGTLQATYTNFSYLNPAAKKLTEEEALLGVSITGVMDNPDILLSSSVQKNGAMIAVEVNKLWASKLGIKQAARVTCIKPEGTASLALGSASGIHPHHARRFLRRVQCNRIDNIYKHFKKINPHACEKSSWDANGTDEIVTFPITVPDKAIIKENLTALKHLEYVRSTQKNWVNTGKTEANNKPVSHNISCTIIVKPNEWDEVTEFIFNQREFFGAVSFIPNDGDKKYEQAPLEAIGPEDEERWNKLVDKFSPVDYADLEENDDLTQHMQEISCGGGQCLI